MFSRLISFVSHFLAMVQMQLNCFLPCYPGLSEIVKFSEEAHPELQAVQTSDKRATTPSPHNEATEEVNMIDAFV